MYVTYYIERVLFRVQSAREKGSVHTNCREGMLRYEYSTVYSKGLAILFFLTWSHAQLAGRAGFWVSRRCGARVDVMAPDVHYGRSVRAHGSLVRSNGTRTINLSKFVPLMVHYRLLLHGIQEQVCTSTRSDVEEPAGLLVHVRRVRGYR